MVSQRVITSPPHRLDSIATKIAIQMNCKLGGIPWMPNIPPIMSNIMTMGFDIAKDTVDPSKRYSCLVATMDLYMKKQFFSNVQNIVSGDCSRELVLSVGLALDAYEDAHGKLPKQIICYRGGVGDDDLPYVRDVEVRSLVEYLKKRHQLQDMEPDLVYIVVTKKINTRFFQKPLQGTIANNPDAGVVVDDVITLSERYKMMILY